MSNPYLKISNEVRRALSLGAPVVALESTVITHGLPHPHNLGLARDMEQQVRAGGAVPATIAMIGGEIRVGLSDADLVRLASSTSALKISQRDFATAVIRKADGGTTVAGTMIAAHLAGIRIFATGGIGGVHRESSFDVSTDLHALAGIPIIVVCAGAKAILDLPATLETLETLGVPVIGYQTDEFPAFYSRESGLNVSSRLDSPIEIAHFAKAHWKMGMKSAVLVANPVPAMDAIPRSEMEPVITRASSEASAAGVHGQALTPFLLGRIGEITGGRSMRTNLALLVNNARLAADIARKLSLKKRERRI